MNSKRYLILIASFITFWVKVSACGQDWQEPWQKKPYQQWSKNEASNTLVDSPWAQIKRDNFRSYGMNIRLHSARPIREAIVRLRQIRVNYDNLTEANKATFDSEVKDFLECLVCAKYYVGTLLMVPTDTKVVRDIGELLSSERKSQIYLTSDTGERRSLAKFVPTASRIEKPLIFHNFILYFDRFDEAGNPLLTASNKKLYLQIDDELLRSKMLPGGKITFEVFRLVRKGEVVF